MDDLDIGYVKKYGGRNVEIYQTRVLNSKAKIATEFVTRWGMIMPKPDGEDSAGRQRFTLMTPDELVERAIMVADLLINEFEARGWLLHVPAPETDEYDRSLK